MDKHLYAVKGGCNLRFFFKSIRYSKDLDLDVHTTAKETLRKNVNQILKFPGLAQHSARTAWKSASFPPSLNKTETTQRWKIHLRADTWKRAAVTKIEATDAAFDERVPSKPSIQRLRGFTAWPILTTHWLHVVRQAFAQKAGRNPDSPCRNSSATCSISLLLDAGATGSALLAETREKGHTVRNAIYLRYDDFIGQVVAYLTLQYQEFTASRVTWDKLQEW